jgi:SAM-dependent methyltransferase
MAPTAAYDEIADWYEQEFLGSQPATGNSTGGTTDADPLGIGYALRQLLGHGSGTCLEIGCGTGVHAGRVRELGWTPVGVDLSAGMLRHARGRLALARADAQRLPVRDGAVPAAIAVMVHTDMPGYPAVLGEAAPRSCDPRNPRAARRAGQAQEGSQQGVVTWPGSAMTSRPLQRSRRSARSHATDFRSGARR